MKEYDIGALKEMSLFDGGFSCMPWNHNAC